MHRPIRTQRVQYSRVARLFRMRRNSAPTRTSRADTAQPLPPSASAPPVSRLSRPGIRHRAYRTSSTIQAIRAQFQPSQRKWPRTMMPMQSRIGSSIPMVVQMFSQPLFVPSSEDSREHTRHRSVQIARAPPCCGSADPGTQGTGGSAEPQLDQRRRSGTWNAFT
jgi:hypothetical protein